MGTMKTSWSVTMESAEALETGRVEERITPFSQCLTTGGGLGLCSNPGFISGKGVAHVNRDAKWD